MRNELGRSEKPEAGDVVILLGGKTGCDGVGGATGSSKVQTVESVETAGAEVQKGNAIEERKIQGLFRNSRVTRLIKKSNDFGAGGVCVAIGELSDGLEIDLDKVILKFQGLNGTEITISESQERMSVVVRPKDADQFIDECRKENINALIVVVVTEKPNLVMTWNGQKIVDIERSFLDTNGVRVGLLITKQQSLSNVKRQKKAYKLIRLLYFLNLITVNKKDFKLFLTVQLVVLQLIFL